MQVWISPQGQVCGLYDEQLELSTLGRPKIRRASHVEPNAIGKWQADLSPVGGPVLGPFERRSEALAAEVRWIEATGFPPVAE